jgi:hypothetical protein
MKKIILALFLFLTIFSTKAQYGHRTYYCDTLTNESWAKGIISILNPNGTQPVYAAIGTVIPTQTSVQSRARFLRSKLDGTLLNNRQYLLYKNSLEASAHSNGIAESAAKFVLAGSVYGGGNPSPFPGTSDVLIMKTSVSGAPMTPSHVDLGGGFDEALCVKNSRYDSSKFYSCGYSTLQGVSRAFIIKHNATGSTVYWARYFTLPCNTGAGNARATYLVDDPAGGNICMVGTIGATGAGCRQSFIMKMTRAGVLTWLYIYSYPNGSGLDFNSIKPTEMANQYIITGTVAIPASLNDRILLFRVNTAGAAPAQVFANILYSNGPTPNFPVTNQHGLDVILRTSPNLEYYVCGQTVYNGGSTDGVIFKTNSAGVPSAARLYGGAGMDQLNAIDWLNIAGAGGNGLASFGQYDYFGVAGTSPKHRSWLLKSYFNLVTGCNEVVDTPHYVTIFLANALYQPTVLTSFIADTLSYVTTKCKQSILCWNTTVPGGSNTRIPSMLSENNSSKINIYPNPLSSDEFNLEIPASSDGIAEIKIMDAAGRIVDEMELKLFEGTNFKVNMSENSKGLYFVDVITSEGSFVNKLLKE